MALLIFGVGGLLDLSLIVRERIGEIIGFQGAQNELSSTKSNSKLGSIQSQAGRLGILLFRKERVLSPVILVSSRGSVIRPQLSALRRRKLLPKVEITAGRVEPVNKLFETLSSSSFVS